MKTAKHNPSATSANKYPTTEKLRIQKAKGLGKKKELFIWGVKGRTYSVPKDDQMVNHFTSFKKAVAWAMDDITVRCESKDVSELLPADDKTFSPPRITFTSYYGNFACAYEFIKIRVN